MRAFKTCFYSNLINNFFLNLNTENLKDCGLSSDYIAKIKCKYRKLQKRVESTLSEPFEERVIDDVHYNNFKAEVTEEFPEALTLIVKIEKEVGLEKATEYLTHKAEEIKKTGKSREDFDCLLKTTAIEAYVKQRKRFPSGAGFERLFNALIEALPRISEDIVEYLRESSKGMLQDERDFREGFEERLYERWKEPLDLLEPLIRISLESGESHKNKLAKVTNETNKDKFGALIKIHARALQIANEILVLLKAGYADGAIARWRSLYELAVISCFLSANNNEVSKRYLEHEIVGKYKDARDYQKYCEKLGYPPIEKDACEKIKKEAEKILKKYETGFDKDYGWVPASILPNRNFRALAEFVELDRDRPFYNLSKAAVHGGSRGFYRLGLTEDSQHKLLLAGASNYGLADPLQLTFISLNLVTVYLLTLEPDLESLTHSYVMLSFGKEIGAKAVDIQKIIEKEELSKSG